MRADFFPDADPILQGRVAIIEVTAKDTRDPLQEHGRWRHEALRRELPHGLVCVGAHLFDPAPTQEGPQDGGPRLVEDHRAAPDHRTASDQPRRPPLGIYGSTRTYRPVFEMHGWGEVTSELHALLERGDTDAMTSLITAEMLDTFSVSATWGHRAAALAAATAAWWIVSRPTAPTCGRPKPACCGTRSPPTCAISPDDDKRAGFLGRCGNPP